MRATLLIWLMCVSTAFAADKVKLTLDWVPEPEFGGIYAAQANGTFAKNNLDVQITPGGAGTPTWQLVANGKTDFAVASADEVVIAQAQGADVVAIFATYQTCPQGIMVHASRGFKNISDVFQNSGTVAMEPGLPYVNFLKKKFGFDKVKVVAYDGGPGTFLNNKDFAQQCFVTSEPLAAKKAGADPQVFLIADAGYNPYTTVIITTAKIAKENPGLVRNMFQSLQEGWQTYLANPGPANAVMEKLNGDMDPQTFDAAAEAQKPLIETDETKSHGLGTMTLPRWQTLVQQLVDLKVIEKPVPAETCFVAAQTKACVMQSGGQNVLRLTASADTDCVAKDGSLDLTHDHHEAEIWLVPAAHTVDQAVANLDQVIKSEFKNFKPTSTTTLTVAGSPAKQLSGPGNEADDGDDGAADVIVFKVADHIFVACTHGEALMPEAQQWMVTVVKTAQVP